MLSHIIFFFTFFPAFNFPLSSFYCLIEYFCCWAQYAVIGENIQKHQRQEQLFHVASLSLLMLQPSPLIQCLTFGQVNER